MVITIKKIGSGDIKLIETFLKNAGSSLTTFRYFSTREMSVIRNHLVTGLLMEDNKPVGYCHLDQDGNDIWLGIAVIEEAKGKGYGKKLMDFLKTYIKESQHQVIRLTVDKDNETAIDLYKKFGFVIKQELQSQILLMEYYNF